MQPYPHTFTSQLKSKNCVEHDSVTFEIDTEASDAEVTAVTYIYLHLDGCPQLLHLELEIEMKFIL